MLRRILFVCLYSLMLPVLIQAQQPQITRSTSFDEPSDGASRLLLMKNGNTMFLHFTRKSGIDVVVYDKNHHAGTLVNNHVNSWKQKQMVRASLAGLFELNGQAVAFLVQYLHKKPCLYRFIFDGTTGKLVNEELVADLPRLGLAAGYSLVYGGVSMPDFFVRKDPESEYYAVAAFNSFAHDRNERIKVTHFGPDHKKINEAFYESPKGTYKYLEFMEMFVHRDEFVFVASYGYNTRASGGKDSRVIISRLMKGTKQFEYNLLNYTDDYREPDIAVKYNASNKTLYMLAAVNAKSAGRPYTMYTSSENMVLQMNVINPNSLEVRKKYFIDHPELSDYAKNHLKYKKPYYGVIQDFRINTDSTITLMFEELNAQKDTRVTTNYNNIPGGTTSTRSSSTSTSTSISTTLGDIGIVRINEEGQEIPGSYAIAKKQVTATWLNDLYIYRRPQTSWTFRRGILRSGNYNAGFFSYDYVFANNTGYTIFNESPDNTKEENENYRKKKGHLSVSIDNTILAWYADNTVKKAYLFGEPKKKDESRFSVLEMNTHSEDGKSLATLMLERKGNDKKAYIVWVNFEENNGRVVE
ncbi:hypothetical protein ACDQ55_08380 [Chitinophaga sp. 30R24]|uniref:hypothetical protein n=1 Tax=Chitinophaga sp. 30R24 TaxID=3248838 RepID=UPI003B90DD4A